MIGECSICLKQKGIHARKMCNSCHHKEYYKNNFERDREKRNLNTRRYYKTPRGRFKFSQNRSKKRKLQWTLTFDDYVNLILKNCHYCNNKLNDMGTGLDRMDSNIGYVLGNVVPCCSDCNKIKNDVLNYDEMKIVINALMIYRLEGKIA